MSFYRDEGDLGELPGREVFDRYRAVDTDWGADDDPSGRARAVDRLAAELLRRRPDAGAIWYDRGRFAKWRGDWAAAADYSRRALDLLPPDGREGEPEAWNLGIAATALHDWATARAAWTAFGVPLPPATDVTAPVEADFGVAPVRLNPDPRFVGQERLLIDGREWATEVVWGRRLCPARIRIENVPTPDSGHRHGDVVLHDGDTVGSRRLGDAEVGVFDEIALWWRNPRPTLSAVVTAPDAAALEELTDRFDAAGAAAEDWTGGVQLLCKACSEGAPVHDHAHAASGWTPERRVGIAATEAEARDVLTRWTSSARGRTYRNLDVALP